MVMKMAAYIMTHLAAGCGKREIRGATNRGNYHEDNRLARVTGVSALAPLQQENKSGRVTFSGRV